VNNTKYAVNDTIATWN